MTMWWGTISGKKYLLSVEYNETIQFHGHVGLQDLCVVLSNFVDEFIRHGTPVQ